MPGIRQAQALTVIDQKLHRGLIPRQNYLWVGLSRFLEAVGGLLILGTGINLLCYSLPALVAAALIYHVARLI